MQRERTSNFGRSAGTFGRFLLLAAAQTIFGSCGRTQVEVALLVGPVLLGLPVIRTRESQVFARDDFRFFTWRPNMKSINLFSRKRLLYVVLCVSMLACIQPASALDSDKADSGKATVTHDTKTANAGWTQFEDSFEHAFSLSAPQGWTVQGGLFRVGFSDARLIVNVKSPDGKIDLRIGDLTIPVYTPPSQYRPREGQILDLGAQAQLVIAKYRTGPQFAVLYSQGRFGSVCKNPQQNPTKIDFIMPDYSPMDFTPKHASAGQIAWLCQTTDGPRVALTFTRTIDAGKAWGVLTMVSLMAPPDEVQQARDIALQCVRSLKIEPKWIVYQHDMDKEGLEYQRTRQGRRICGEGQNRQFELRMRKMREEVNAFERHEPVGGICWGWAGIVANALNGITPTIDPLAGEHRTGWTGPKDNYWVNGFGQVVNATNAPSSAYRHLQTP